MPKHPRRGSTRRGNRCPKCGHVRKAMQGPDAHLGQYRCEVCNPVGPVESAVRGEFSPGICCRLFPDKGGPQWPTTHPMDSPW